MSPWLSDLLLRSQTDERLLALAQLGHKRAFELIVERYRRPLTAYAHRIDPDRGEDLVQQTFLSAFSALQRGTEVRHLRGWLYEILRNQARREYVPAAIHAELDEADSVTDSAQTVAERRMLAVDALGAVAGLPARQHDAIVQMAFGGLSRTEVAHSMGLSEGAVRQLVHRARTAVRTAVTAITPMPILRWLYSPRSGSATGLTEATLGAGTASGAGIALKVGVGAIVATGVVAGGVISAVSPHHRAVARLASRSQAAAGRSAGGAGAGANAPGAVNQGAAGSSRPVFGQTAGQGHGTSGGQVRFTLSQPSATVGSDGPSAGRDGSSSGSSGPGDGGSSGSGPGSGDGGGGSGSGSSGPGPGDHGSTGSDGGTGSSSGSGTDGGGSTSTSDGGSSGGSGSTDGGGSQTTTVSSSDGGGTSGGDGGVVSSDGGTGTSSGSDGGSLTGSGSVTSSSGDTSGSSGTSGSTSTSGSDGGSGSSGTSGSTSISGSDGGSGSTSTSGSTGTSGSDSGSSSGS